MTTLMRNDRDRRSGKPGMGHARKERVLLFGTRSADYIRASSQSGCIQRPNTWLHPNVSLNCPIFPLHRGRRPYMAHRVALLNFGRFSNRPFWVKRFQTIHQCSVGVAHGLVLLFGIGTKALPSWESRTRRNNLSGGLAVRRTAGPSDQANSPHPSSREGHLSTVGWNSSILLWDVILCGRHPAAISRVQRNSVPSTQMRCMITASRRANATIAFFFPRFLAIFIAQALSQDHLLVRVSMTWAAS